MLFWGPPACTCNYTLSTSLSVTRREPHGERLSSFASFLSFSMWRNDAHLLSSTFPSLLLCPACTLCQSSTYVILTPAPPILSNRSLYAVCHCRPACAGIQTAPLPGARRFPSSLLELPAHAAVHYCTWHPDPPAAGEASKQSAAGAQQAPSGQAPCLMRHGQLWSWWSFNPDRLSGTDTTTTIPWCRWR